MAIRSADPVDSLDAYHAAIERLNLDGLWRIGQQVLHRCQTANSILAAGLAASAY